MRVLPARRLASSALCAVLLTAVAAPTALAADADQAPRQGERSAPRAPLPGADALLAQVKSLGDAGGVLAAVAPLLDSALKADKGQLPKEQATQLATAAKDAIQKASAAAPATPTAPAAPAVPATPAAPSAPGAPGPGKHGKTVAAAIADVKAEALTALGTSVDTLAAATTSGDAAKVAPAAGGVVAAEVNVLAATLLGGGLPAPNLPGLPKLPSLPAAAPAVPAAPSLPAAPNPVTG
ncbi:hypothetical protein [Streptomyces sp. NPDC101249]|uniref:hypothetical protein n=1 Tax=Streptomyces sp. NPDC101249 TaxID=3366140 RepID=UPI003801E373